MEAATSKGQDSRAPLIGNIQNRQIHETENKSVVATVWDRGEWRVIAKYDLELDPGYGCTINLVTIQKTPNCIKCTSKPVMAVSLRRQLVPWGETCKHPFYLTLGESRQEDAWRWSSDGN